MNIHSLEVSKRILRSCCDNDGRAMSLTVLLGQLSGSHRADSGFDVRFHCLPAEELLDFCGSEDFISRFMQQHSSHSREAIFGLESHVAAVVLDLFSTMFLDVTCNLDLPGYVYFTSTASLLSLVLRLLVLDQEMLVDFEEMEGVVDLLGLLSVPATLLPTPVIKKDCVEIMGTICPHGWIIRLVIEDRSYE